ncbi:hypothetical protein, partial [Mycobacterium sp.]|uniref:hypothetical protein n=1 Tax=Mycobacterium sp. TaxID=1785 RepID=UPI003C7355BF
PQPRPFPAIPEIPEVFSGIEIRPHVLHHAFYPRLIFVIPNSGLQRLSRGFGYPECPALMQVEAVCSTDSSG